MISYKRLVKKIEIRQNPVYLIIPMYGHLEVRYEEITSSTF